MKMDKKNQAKYEMLKHLKKMATGSMGGMQKVSVMAKDKEGLREGLDKAEDVLDQMPAEEEEVDMEGHEEEGHEEEGHGEEEMEEEEMNYEEMDKEALIELLKNKLK